MVCQPKEEGGLGVRDIRVVNLSLLAKWRWRMLQGEDLLWMEDLLEKYGPSICGILDWSDAVWPHFASNWWRDVVLLDRGGGVSWFNEEVVRKVHDGVDTSFWKVVWRGCVNFRQKYPRLFAVSNQKEAKVVDILKVTGTGNVWNLSWRRRFFVWEEDFLGDLMEDLNGHVVSGGADRWRWKLEEDGGFTVRSMYLKLLTVLFPTEPKGVEELKVFSQIWKSPVPSKVVAFSWKVLLNRIPTRINLSRRNVVPPNALTSCVFCGLAGETKTHMFVHCGVVWNIWEVLLHWLQGAFIMPPNLFIHWASFGNK